MIFTESKDAQFSAFDQGNVQFKDAKLSILFETQEMMEETLILLRFNCPDTDCTFIARSWNDLKVHVRATHGKLMWSVSFNGLLLESLMRLCLAICVFVSRKSSRMNIHYIPLASFTSMSPPWRIDLRNQSKKIRSMVECIPSASFARNAFSGMMNCSLTCEKDMRNVLFANEVEFEINSESSTYADDCS